MLTRKLESHRALPSSTALKDRADLLAKLVLSTTALLCVVFAGLAATSSTFWPFSTSALRATVATGPATASPGGSWSLSRLADPQRNELAVPAAPSHGPRAHLPALVGGFGKLPMSFEANSGQTDSSVKFVARGRGYSLFLTGKEAVLALRKAAPASNPTENPALQPGPEPRKAAETESTVIRMELVAANSSPHVAGAEELPGKVNYFIGNDPTKWRTNVPTYAKVKYEGVYSGVDLVYYGNQGQLEYDFVVAPGADPNRIELKFRGAGKLRVDENGDLLLGASGETVRLQKPVAYQTANGVRKAIEGCYVMTAANLVGFQLGDYDHTQALVIDPVLWYSTYLGGGGGESGNAIAVDVSGNVYITGETGSPDFPTTPGAFQPTISSGGFPVFVSKINATGTALVYSTFLGGNGAEGGDGIAVDASGNAYVTGSTRSTNFPTVNAFQPASGLPGGFNAFVTKFNPSGSALLYSTYLGGTSSAEALAIAVDASNSAYVTGSTLANFPTVNAIQPKPGNTNGNAFITKFSPSGSALVYSTYLSGSGSGASVGDQGTGIAVDSSGSAYVVGITTSPDFPTANALQPTLPNGNASAFVAKFNPSGSALVYSTYLGGGLTPAPGGVSSNAIAVDASERAYVTGRVATTDFPLVNAVQSSIANGNGIAFISVFNPAGSALVFSTYLGGTTGGLGDAGAGIAADAAYLYVTGGASSTDFPTANALQPTLGGNTDAFIAKISLVSGTTGTTTSLASSANPASSGQSVTFTATVTPSAGGPPTGTVTFQDGSVVLGSGTLNTSAQATFTTSSLALGTHSISGIYVGDANFASSRGTISQVINLPPTPTSISVTPTNPVLFMDDSQQFTATGQYSTGTIDLTNSATWASSNPAVATVNTSGLATAIGAGSTNLTATYNGVSSSPVSLVVNSRVANVLFLGGGSSSLFAELGQAAVNQAGAGACVWTQGSNVGIGARDLRTSPGPTDDRGESWVVWTPGSGTCTAPAGSYNVWSYMSVDSGVANRCYFEVDSSGIPGCAQVMTIAAGTAGANKLCYPAGTTCTSFADTAGGIAASVISALNGQHWFVVGTPVLPSDAKYAMFRMLQPCGAVVYRQPFDQELRTSYGLGYAQGISTAGVGANVLSYYSATESHTLDFNISGNDPINTTAAVPAYTVTTVGAQPIVVAVGPAGGTSIGAATDIPSFVLMNFYDGTLSRSTDLLGPTVQSPVTTLVREPQSGDYNVFEWSAVNTSQFHDSQDAFNCNVPTGGVYFNPMNLYSANRNANNPYGYRRRVIGTAEMTAQLQAGTASDNRLGYFFWNAGNASSFTATNGKYLTVNGVDPLTDGYTDGVFPGADSSHPLSNVTFKSLNEGDYPIWSAVRIVSRSPVPVSVTNLIQAVQTLNSTQHDFIPASALKVWHSHFSLSAIGDNTAANGTTINSSGDLCSATGALAESGGDAGGATILKQANADFCADYANVTGLVSKTN